ncbi:MAG: hypothetical protein A2Y48_10010 [Nitrospirae bacterium RIFCSPLOW2_12_42_9]|nr:MAG: hypothetical protein A2Y48_10010 [Nitrospirae bacterium RIFCSPLOW2_12_42_9]
MNLKDLGNLPRSQKIILLALIFIVLIGGFVYFIFLPGKAEFDALKTGVNELNQKINTNEVKLRRLEELKVENMQLQSQLAMLQAQLPMEQEVSSLLKQVSDLSIESGLEVKLWKPGARKKDSSGMYLEIPVDVEVSGGYHSLASFFDRISKLPRIVNITNLNMDGAKVSGGGISIQNKFVATTFSAVIEGTEELPDSKKVNKKDKDKEKAKESMEAQ